jgi:hypothetical protein
MPDEKSPSQLTPGPGQQLNLGILKQMYGDLVLQIVALQTENGLLKQQVVELGRKVPPEGPAKEPNDPEGDTKPN